MGMQDEIQQFKESLSKVEDAFNTVNQNSLEKRTG